MASLVQVKEMLRLCKLNGLAGTEFVEALSIEQLMVDFNGIGPDFFPDKLRKFIDKLCYVFLPAAFIHDARWSHSDGSTAQFLRSNEELELNCRILAYANYAWYNPMRYIRLHQATTFRKLCDTFGYGAYRAAYKKQNKEDK